MKKLFLGSIVAVLFAVFLCGCSNGADLQKRVDALEESNSRLEERVEELERENDLLWDMMSEMGLKDGEFYTLQQAYDAGWLTQDDLKSIAYYHNGGREGNEEIMGEDYQPQPKTPEVIDKMTELSIKQTYCNNLRKQDNAKPSGVTIERYYGAYNDSYAVVLDSIYVVYPADVINEWETVGSVNINYYDYLSFYIWKAKSVLAEQIKTDYVKIYNHDNKYDYGSKDLRLSVYGKYCGTCVMFIDGPWDYMDVITTETVDDVVFVYGSSRTLTAYNGGKFYSLQQAYENEFLTHNDLLDINEKYQAKQFKVY